MKKVMLRLTALVLSANVTELRPGSQKSFMRGERYADRGDWDLAVKEYREANKRQPNDIEYRSALIRAEETAANQHHKKARQIFLRRANSTRPSRSYKRPSI